MQIDDGRDRPPGEADMPAWRRHTHGEQRWPGAVAVLGMIVLQLFLPDRLSLGGRWLLPGMLPLSRGAKIGMLLQSAISLVTAALVVAKAVNTMQ